MKKIAYYSVTAHFDGPRPEVSNKRVYANYTRIIGGVVHFNGHRGQCVYMISVHNFVHAEVVYKDECGDEDE